MPEIDYKEVYFSEYCKTCKQSCPATDVLNTP